MIKCIVCPVDGSQHSDRAIELSADLAVRYGAKLRFFHVFLKGMSHSDLDQFSENAHLRDIVSQEIVRLSAAFAAAVGPYPVAYMPHPSAEVVTRIASVVLEDAKNTAIAKSVSDVTVTSADGNPAEKILEFAESQHADMIVMGSRGLTGLKSLLLGSTSQKVSHLAQCTCVTVT